MKILLTGAGGLLGTAIQDTAATRTSICDPFARPSQSSSDVNASSLADAMRGYDVLIHAAANTNVEQCEISPDECYRDNFLLTELLAQAALIARVKMVFVSSTGVYGDGKNTPYREYDGISPGTHHHRSKQMAEQSVLGHHAGNLVVRTGWLFGGPANNPKNFVARRIEEARLALQTNGHIESNAEQRGVPCFNVDIAARLLELACGEWSGIFNCVNSGDASRYEYVKSVIKLAGIPVEVRPSGASIFNRKAKVANNEMAENWKMQSLGLASMPDWRSSLAKYIKGSGEIV